MSRTLPVKVDVVASILRGREGRGPVLPNPPLLPPTDTSALQSSSQRLLQRKM